MAPATARKTSADYSDLLGKLQDIPTLPLVAKAVNDLINDPKSSSADIADVLKKDQVLTAKILRLVNSSYYAIPGGIADVQRALAFLGFNTLAQLVLSLSVFSLFSTFDNDEFNMLDFWRHALGTAVCSSFSPSASKYHVRKRPSPAASFTTSVNSYCMRLIPTVYWRSCARQVGANRVSSK